MKILTKRNLNLSIPAAIGLLLLSTLGRQAAAITDTFRPDASLITTSFLCSMGANYKSAIEQYAVGGTEAQLESAFQEEPGAFDNRGSDGIFALVSDLVNQPESARSQRLAVGIVRAAFRSPHMRKKFAAGDPWYQKGMAVARYTLTSRKTDDAESKRILAELQTEVKKMGLLGEFGDEDKAPQGRHVDHPSGLVRFGKTHDDSPAYSQSADWWTVAGQVLKGIPGVKYVNFIQRSESGETLVDATWKVSEKSAAKMKGITLLVDEENIESVANTIFSNHPELLSVPIFMRSRRFGRVDSIWDILSRSSRPT